MYDPSFFTQYSIQGIDHRTRDLAGEIVYDIDFSFNPVDKEDRTFKYRLSQETSDQIYDRIKRLVDSETIEKIRSSFYQSVQTLGESVDEVWLEGILVASTGVKAPLRKQENRYRNLSYSQREIEAFQLYVATVQEVLRKLYGDIITLRRGITPYPSVELINSITKANGSVITYNESPNTPYTLEMSGSVDATFTAGFVVERDVPVEDVSTAPSVMNIHPDHSEEQEVTIKGGETQIDTDSELYLHDFTNNDLNYYPFKNIRKENVTENEDKYRKIMSNLIFKMASTNSARTYDWSRSEIKRLIKFYDKKLRYFDDSKEILASLCYLTAEQLFKKHSNYGEYTQLPRHPESTYEAMEYIDKMINISISIDEVYEQTNVYKGTYYDRFFEENEDFPTFV